VTSEGTRTTPSGLYAHESGDGPLVVLVHGAMDRSSGMLRTRRLLVDGHRVALYDRRGYGRSRGVPVSDDVGDQVRDLVEVLDGRPAVVAGHSFGGVVALGLAARYPALVRAVVAYESPMMWEPWWPADSTSRQAASPTSRASEDPAGAAEWFMRRMLGTETWDRLPKSFRAERRAEGEALLTDLRSCQPPQPAPYRPEELAMPVVAAYGSRGRPHHRRAAEELARRAPRGELHVVEGADHGVHLTAPAAFAGLVARALAVADAPSAPVDPPPGPTASDDHAT
jgi:pimeloyl-ACP methyl ester carboxylesterase